MNKLKQALENQKFVFTTEIYPPKGTDTTKFLRMAQIVKRSVTAVNVTDNQRALVKLSSIAGCLLLRKQGIEPVYQITTRDRNRIAIQSELMGAYALGIRNILAITGDHTLLGDCPEAKPVYDLDSVQLLYLISKLNSGFDINEHPLQGKTDFFYGAVVNPEASDLEPELIKFEKKIKCGAQFFQTQIIWDIDKFKKFMKYASKFNVKILAGIIIISSSKVINLMNKKVPGIKIPDSIIRRIEKSSDPVKEGVKIASEQIKELQGVCDGAHIITVGKEDLTPQVIEMSR